jgi:hypothetical protein
MIPEKITQITWPTPGMYAIVRGFLSMAALLKFEIFKIREQKATVQYV